MKTQTTLTRNDHDCRWHLARLAGLIWPTDHGPRSGQEPRPGTLPDRRHAERPAAARLPLPRERGADVPRLRPGAVPAAGAGPEGRAERRPDPDRRRRLRPVQHVRRRRALADDGQARGRRAALQPLPHDRPVQPDAGRAPHGPQPPLGRVRRHPGGRDGLRRLHRRDPPQRGHDRRGAAPERLHDRLDREEPQHADLGGERGRAVRPLGQWPGVRLLLRLQRRRHEPLEPGALREPEPRPCLDRPELPPDDRPRRPRHRLGAQGQEHRARTAVLPVRGAWRDALAAPRPAGLDRQVQGQVRHGLGQVPRGDLRAAEDARRRPAGRQAHGALSGAAGVGLAQRRPEAAVRAHDGGFRRLRRQLRLPHGARRRCREEHARRRQHDLHLHRRRQRRERRRGHRGLGRTRTSSSTASSRSGRTT